MTAPLFFEFLDRPGDRSGRGLGICLASPSRASSTLEPALSKFLRAHRTPDTVYIFARQQDASGLQSVLEGEAFQQRLAGLSSAPPIIPVLLRADSFRMQEFEVAWAAPIEDATRHEQLRRLRHAGMQAIFRACGGMLHGSDSHHYAKPSGKHSDRFIRTANILHDSSAVSFIALWLAECLPADIEHIYCDTSSIHPIVYQALVYRFASSVLLTRVSVDSFRSYDGLAAFDFGDVTRSIAIISASTSGDLAEKLVTGSGFHEDSLFTLYTLGATNSKGHVLCDLTLNPATNPEGFTPIQSFPERDCALCKGHSLPTVIVGDQFLTERPRVSARVLTAADAPSILRPFMEEFRHSDLFRVQRFEPAASEHLNLAIDLSGPLRDASLGRFHTHLKQAVEKAVPASTKQIVYCSTNGSRVLAETICELASGMNLKSAPSLVSVRELLANPDNLKSGSTLIVADVMTDGREMTNISRILRRRHGEGAVVYFVGIVSTETDAAFREIRSNLMWGDRGTATFGFEHVRVCFLPRASTHLPWKREYELYRDLEEFCTDEQLATPAILRRRRERLEESGAEGLIDDLFLPSLPDSRPLRIRKNFAFFDTNERTDSVKQSTVFAAIAIVLNALRTSGDAERALANEHYCRTVLSPSNFDRFNDGIIQASILRAALPFELSFSQDRSFSQAFGDVLEGIFRASNEVHGEAALEFLVALMTRRVSLLPDDLARVIRVLEESNESSGALKVGARYLAQRVALAN